MIDEQVRYSEEADFRYVTGMDGGAVVVRCIAHGAQVRVPARLGGRPVVAVGDESFASVESGGMSLKVHNGELERVELPEGLVRIGRAAFRGCSRLSRVALPESLEEVDDLAFSCTSVGSLRLPRACVRLSELALRTGPESLAGAGEPYFSKLDAIEVDLGNPVFCTSGGALCRRLGEGGFEALLCPGKADELRLGREVVRIAPTAFAGTYEIGVLGFCESVAFAEGCGLAARATCDRVEIDLERPFGESSRLALSMPSKALQGGVFASTVGRPAFDLAAFLAAYDAAIAEEPDPLLRSKLVAGRLARPLHLDAQARSSLERLVTPLLDTICIQFGARGYWRGFDDLADAGLLDARTIPHAIEVLTARADAAAAARLLELKRTRFGEGGWDYAL